MLITSFNSTKKGKLLIRARESTHSGNIVICKWSSCVQRQTNEPWIVRIGAIHFNGHVYQYLFLYIFSGKSCDNMKMTA